MNELALVFDEGEKNLVVTRDLMLREIGAAKAVVVTDGDSEKLSIDSQATIREMSKKLTEIQKAATKPAYDFIKRVNTYFRPLLEGAEEAVEALKATRRAYASAQAEKTRLEAVEALKAGQAPASKSEGPVRGESAQASYTKVWTFEVVDAAAVPREYCQPVDKLIRAAVTAGRREIPGVRVFEEMRDAIR